MRLLALLLIFSGEAAAIWAELHVAKYGMSVWPSAGLVGVFLAGVLLLLGYRMGYEQFRSIWTITVISVCSIALLEPSMIYIMFREAPSTKQFVGFLLGLLGILVVSL